MHMCTLMCACVHTHTCVCPCVRVLTNVHMSHLRKLTTESVPGVDARRTQERLVRVADAVVEGEH